MCMNAEMQGAVYAEVQQQGRGEGMTGVIVFQKLGSFILGVEHHNLRGRYG